MTEHLAEVTSLEQSLGHVFADRSILAEALTHSSYASENPGTGFNERFEFLGDAVLQLAVTEFLFATFPHLPEGQMAKIRAGSVSGADLTETARKLGLGDHLRLGRGEEASGGREKDSILADAMEALIAAVHLDADYPTARRVILSLWEERVRSRATAPGRRDFKTRLQETLAASGRFPEYVVDAAGPDHARHFTAVVLVDGAEKGKGEGRSKKEAQQAAAHQALDALET
ncbi:MAG TPA: ribonuclease III [Acidimicrobiia bacterium]|jgi:ribonuclease-3|nr:ribonuclease III [Acidimicrobiia bacterium]